MHLLLNRASGFTSTCYNSHFVAAHKGLLLATCTRRKSDMKPELFNYRVELLGNELVPMHVQSSSSSSLEEETIIEQLLAKRLNNKNSLLSLRIQTDDLQISQRAGKPSDFGSKPTQCYGIKYEDLNYVMQGSNQRTSQAVCLALSNQKLYVYRFQTSAEAQQFANVLTGILFIVHNSAKIPLTSQSRRFHGYTPEYEKMSYSPADGSSNLGEPPHKRKCPMDETITDNSSVPFQTPKSRCHQATPGRESSVNGGCWSICDSSSAVPGAYVSLNRC